MEAAIGATVCIFERFVAPFLQVFDVCMDIWQACWYVELGHHGWAVIVACTVIGAAVGGSVWYCRRGKRKMACLALLQLHSFVLMWKGFVAKDASLIAPDLQWIKAVESTLEAGPQTLFQSYTISKMAWDDLNGCQRRFMAARDATAQQQLLMGRLQACAPNASSGWAKKFPFGVVGVQLECCTTEHNQQVLCNSDIQGLGLDEPINVEDLMARDPDLKGFNGGFTDGQYGYLLPFGKGEFKEDSLCKDFLSGKVARFELGALHKVEVLDAGATDPELRGFGGGFTDGTYGYMLPSGSCFPPSTKVARFDLSTFSSVDVLDLDGLELNTLDFGYWGGFTDGAFGYLAPSFSGKVARFDLATFSKANILDVSATDPLLEMFDGGFTDGSFGYFVPFKNGKVPRVNLSTFSLVDALNLMATDPDLCCFKGGFSDGTHGYLVPYSAEYAGDCSGKVARFDLATFSKVEVLNLMAIDKDLGCFSGGYTDGVHGYLMPNEHLNWDVVHFSKVARFDLSTFSTVEVLDVSTSTSDADLKGFYGGFTDGRRGFLVPHSNGDGFFGKVVSFTGSSFPASWLSCDPDRVVRVAGAEQRTVVAGDGAGEAGTGLLEFRVANRHAYNATLPKLDHMTVISNVKSLAMLTIAMSGLEEGAGWRWRLALALYVALDLLAYGLPLMVLLAVATSAELMIHKWLGVLVILVPIVTINAVALVTSKEGRRWGLRDVAMVSSFAALLPPFLPYREVLQHEELRSVPYKELLNVRLCAFIVFGYGQLLTCAWDDWVELAGLGRNAVGMIASGLMIASVPSLAHLFHDSWRATGLAVLAQATLGAAGVAHFAMTRNDSNGTAVLRQTLLAVLVLGGFCISPLLQVIVGMRLAKWKKEPGPEEPCAEDAMGTLTAASSVDGDNAGGPRQQPRGRE